MAADSPITRRPRGQSKKGVLGRFWEKVSPEPNSGCWLWTAGLTSFGYGSFWYKGRTWNAHSAAYALFGGDVPDGMELDHKCRIPCCVNPDHLEPVTHQENVRRGNAGVAAAATQRAKTHCPAGHEYTEENTYRRASHGERECRTCTRNRCRENQRVYRRQMTAEDREQKREYQRVWMRQFRMKQRAIA